MKPIAIIVRTDTATNQRPYAFANAACLCATKTGALIDHRLRVLSGRDNLFKNGYIISPKLSLLCNKVHPNLQECAMRFVTSAIFVLLASFSSFAMPERTDLLIRELLTNNKDFKALLD